MIKIVKIKDQFIYPIFKNGKSSIEMFANSNNCQWLINSQCNRADCVTVFIRQPKDRFISGVHSFIEFEKRKNQNLDYETMLYAIQNYGVTNEHFEPQFFWIKRLGEHYNGQLYLQDVEKLLDLIPNRDRPSIPNITLEQKKKIEKIKLDNFIFDNILFDKYLEEKMKITDLIEEIENAVSSS